MKNEKKNFTGKLFFALTVTVLLAASAFAQEEDDRFDYYRLDAKAVKNSDVSNLDLIRKIFPDARIKKDEPESATAAETVPLRNLFGGGEKNLDGALSLAITGRLETLDGRGKILWLLINVSQPDKRDCDECSQKILAAFLVSRTRAELLDAANVLTSFDAEFDGERPKLKVAPRREAVVVWNFSHTYLEGDAFSVVVADKNGFKILLDQFEVGRNYQCENWYEEEANLRLLKTGAEGFRGIEILVTTKGGTGWYDFPKVKINRRFRYVFGWQPGGQKFEAVVKPESERRALLKRIEPSCPDNR